MANDTSVGAGAHFPSPVATKAKFVPLPLAASARGFSPWSAKSPPTGVIPGSPGDHRDPGERSKLRGWSKFDRGQALDH
jgi:hypothetical protein